MPVAAVALWHYSTVALCRLLEYDYFQLWQWSGVVKREGTDLTGKLEFDQ